MWASCQIAMSSISMVEVCTLYIFHLHYYYDEGFVEAENSQCSPLNYPDSVIIRWSRSRLGARWFVARREEWRALLGSSQLQSRRRHSSQGSTNTLSNSAPGASILSNFQGYNQILDKVSVSHIWRAVQPAELAPIANRKWRQLRETTLYGGSWWQVHARITDS